MSPTATPAPARAPSGYRPATLARPMGAPAVRDSSPAADFVRAVYEVARKEVLQHIRTKRLLIIGIAMAVLVFTVTLGFGPQLMKNVESSDSANSQENTVLAFYFGFALVGGLTFTQLLAIVLTSDAVCSEWSNRTIFLLLSKPVSRTAFVVGKFLGNVAVLAGAILVLFSFAYLLMQPFYKGAPSGAEVGGFFLTVLLVILGCMAYAAMAMFFSTLTKSTVLSTLITLAMWIIVLPLVGMIGFFSNLEDADQEDFFDSKGVQSTLYLNPASDMQSVVPLLLPHDDGDFKEVIRFLNFFNPAPNSVGIAVASLTGYTTVFFAASILVVRMRNFD